MDQVNRDLFPQGFSVTTLNLVSHNKLKVNEILAEGEFGIPTFKHPPSILSSLLSGGPSVLATSPPDISCFGLAPGSECLERFYS